MTMMSASALLWWCSVARVDFSRVVLTSGSRRCRRRHRRRNAFTAATSSPTRSPQPNPKPKQNSPDDLLIRVESGSEDVVGASWGATLLLAAGSDPYALVDAGVAAAASLSGGARPRQAKRLPASLDVFGWCTWDAFYSTVSARGLAEGLASLAAGGVRARTLIVDDGWQMTEVDAEDAKPATQRVAEKLHAPEEASALLEATSEDYFSGKARALREAADQLSLDQEVRNMMPTVANVGEAAVQHHHGHHVGGGTSGGGTGAGGVGVGGVGSMATATSFDGGAAAAEAAAAAGGDEKAPLLPAPQWGAADSAVDPTSTNNNNNNNNNTAPTTTTPTTALASAEEAVAENNSPGVRLVRLGQRLAGALLGVGTAAFLALYQVAVEPAPPDSLRVRGFAALAQGALRGAMLGFYASASDFTRRLTSVRANGKFARPDSGAEDDWDSEAEDLRSVVASLRQRFGVQHVYCWHGMPAYWGGVMPAAPALEGVAGRTTLVYPTPTRSIAEIEPSLLWSPAVLAGVGVAESPDRLYRAMHEYLAAAGVDGVKVDCQAGVGLVGSKWGGGPAAAARFHAALESSIASHFPGNHAINCMCHSTENLYRHAATPVARASDDFYPRDPASSTPHLAACAYNSLFMGALVQPDWDMFQSLHPAANLHAAARAVSGAAVYVSDKPGAHDFELLRRLVLPDGSVLRAPLPGRPTRSALFRDVLRDGASALTVWNCNALEEGAGAGAGDASPSSSSSWGVGVVGAFNLQGASWDRRLRRFCFHERRPSPVSAVVKAHDVEALRERAHEEQHYAAFVQGAQAVRAPLKGDEPVALDLAAASAEVVWFAALHDVPVECAGETVVRFAALGLAHMYNGGGAVLGVDVRAGKGKGGGGGGAAEAGGNTGGGNNGGGNGSSSTATAPCSAAVVQVRGAGDLVMYASSRPRGVWVDLAPRDFSWDEATGALRVAVAPAGGGGGGGGGGKAKGGGNGDGEERDPLRSEVEVLF
jgi:raffinose synthase